MMPEAVFGGSLSLAAVGLIDRAIGDLDVILPAETDLDKLGFFKFICLSRGELTGSITPPDSGIRRVSAKINGVKVCFFSVPSNMTSHTEMQLFGMKLKVQNVNHAIEAKRSYAKADWSSEEIRKKHSDDLISIVTEIAKLLQTPANA